MICGRRPNGERDPVAASRGLSGRARSCSQRSASSARPPLSRHIRRPWLPQRQKGAAAVRQDEAISPLGAREENLHRSSPTLRRRATLGNPPTPLPAETIQLFPDGRLEVVRFVSRSAKSHIGRFCAVSISRLGNGGLYLILAALTFVRWGLSGYRIVVLAAVNAALMHSLYPIIKRHFRRRRPYTLPSGT